MAMSEEMKEQRRRLKERPFKEKLRYFWDYYKVHTILFLLALFIAGIFIRDAMNAKDYAFSATILNAYAMDDQEGIQEDFAAFAGIDRNTYDCYIDTSSTLSYETMSQIDLAVSQRIVAMTQTGGIDILVSDSEPFTNFAEGQMFSDLREVLTEEEYQRFQDDFYYIDLAALEEHKNDMNYDEDGNPKIVDTSIDHSEPSLMKEPVPVGIYVTGAPKLKEWNCYKDSSTDIVFGFVWSSERPEVSHRFLEYLFVE